MHKSIFLFTSENIEKLNNLNLDSVFLSSSYVTNEIIRKIKDTKKLDIYVELGVFANTYDCSDSKPIEVTGKEIPENWHCPTNECVRGKVLENVKKLIDLDIDGIWMDFIRYPTRWEEPEPNILDTCYCDRCLSLFAEYIGEPITGETLEEKYLLIDGSYYIEWLEFKALQITSMVKAVKDEITKSGKNVKLGFFAVPWEDKEYGAGIKRIVAQDFGQLTDLVDMVSPMLYHKMCGKDVEWVKEKVEYFWNLGKPFLPLIQTEDVSIEEFKKASEYASMKPSSGVCIFFLEDLIKQPEKFEVAKEFFSR